MSVHNLPHMPLRSHPTVPDIEQLRQRIGRRVRALRVERDMSQGDLGSPHFDRQYVSAVELGLISPSLAALLHFARSLGMTIAELLNGVDPPRIRSVRGKAADNRNKR